MKLRMPSRIESAPFLSRVDMEQIFRIWLSRIRTTWIRGTRTATVHTIFLKSANAGGYLWHGKSGDLRSSREIRTPTCLGCEVARPALQIRRWLVETKCRDAKRYAGT